ncbi:hypothetical protein OCU04_006564 [Sclerotinia nivalis]|uniref:RRM domain-containing protein n=1 Tax=Sclerotinia nivalis TaxID=352851 RepID=A0A9X0DHZ4_9HELO|nr:hypothetical protein OCU04_006564 [Sclerotinia nivalis]
METTKQQKHIPGTRAYELNTVPIISPSYNRRDTRRGTTPPPETDPIGFERDVARQLGFPALRISPIEDNEPIIDVVLFLVRETILWWNPSPRFKFTSSPGRTLLGHLNVAPEYCHDDNIPVLDLHIPASERNMKDSSSSTTAKKLYGQLGFNQKYPLSCDVHQNTEVRLINVTNEHRRPIRGSQAHNNQGLGRGMKGAAAHQNQSLDPHSVQYRHGTDDAGQYAAQVDEEMQTKNDPSEVDGDSANQPKSSRYNFAYQKSDQMSNGSTPHTVRFQGSDDPGQYGSNTTHSIRASTVGQTSKDTLVALIQPMLNPTNQPLRDTGFIAPTPAKALSFSNHADDHDHRDQYGRLAGELLLPHHLNCAVWIRGMPTEIPKAELFRELFKHISIGPIIAAFISEGDDIFSHRAAKVIFRHPQHANRLCAKAHFQGIYINGEHLHIELHTHGHREYPDKFHYRNRVIIVKVANYPSMGLPYWMSFINRLCIYDIESTRHLYCSTPKRMAIEFRFARIFGQASVFLHSIKNTASFRGLVTARYLPDMACDLH